MNQQLASPTGMGIRFWRDETGVTAIEYGLLAALIAVACIGAFTATGGSVTEVYDYWSIRVTTVLANAAL